MTDFKIILGAEVPDFPLQTTEGNFNFHDYIASDPAKFPYTILFGHPADYTPVCTTELGRAHVLSEQFAQRGVKLIGLSCDELENHHGWIKDILHRVNSKDEKLNFPIIADPKRDMVTKMGMLDPLEIGASGLPLPARALIVIGANKKIRLSILYPASTGRNFDEIIRVVDSLILTDQHKVATPVDWKNPNDRCVVLPSVSMEEAEKKFQNMKIEELPSKKGYLRTVDCPTNVTKKCCGGC